MPEGMLAITILFFVTLILALLSPLQVALLLIEVQFGAGLMVKGVRPARGDVTHSLMIGGLQG